MGLIPLKKQIKQYHITVPLSVFFKQKGAVNRNFCIFTLQTKYPALLRSIYFNINSRQQYCLYDRYGTQYFYQLCADDL